MIDFKFTKRFAFVSIMLLFLPFSFAQERPIAKKISSYGLENQKISVSWTFPQNTDPKITSIKLYRDTRAITTYAQLARLKPIAVLTTDKTAYTDTVQDLKEYFYAVIAQTQDVDYQILIPALNSTAQGVRTLKVAKKQKSIDSDSLDKKETIYAKSEVRELPLPSPYSLSTLSSEKTPMSEKSLKAAKTLGSGFDIKKEPFKNAYFFEEDLFAPEGGDDYILFETLRKGLARKAYKTSVKDLKSYLSIHREKEPGLRATFYLGESLYFTKKYSEAIKYFLQTEERYPELSQKWIDSCLDLFEIK